MTNTQIAQSRDLVQSVHYKRLGRVEYRQGWCIYLHNRCRLAEKRVTPEFRTRPISIDRLSGSPNFGHRPIRPLLKESIAPWTAAANNLPLLSHLHFCLHAVPGPSASAPQPSRTFYGFKPVVCHRMPHTVRSSQHRSRRRVDAHVDISTRTRGKRNGRANLRVEHGEVLQRRNAAVRPDVDNIVNTCALNVRVPCILARL